MIRNRWWIAGVCATSALAACSVDTSAYTFTDVPAGGGGTSGSGGSSAGAGGTSAGAGGTSTGGKGGSAGTSGASGASGASGTAGIGGAGGKGGTGGSAAGTSGSAGASGKAGNGGSAGASGKGGAGGSAGATGGSAGTSGGSAGTSGAGGASGAAGASGASGAGGTSACVPGTKTCNGKSFLDCSGAMPTATMCADGETCDADAGCIHATRVFAGSRHVCALMSDSTVVCWGANEAGQIGTGAMAPTSPPARVVTNVATSAPLRNVKQLSLGAASTCALIDDGMNPPKVVCWGSDKDGQLGDGASNSSRALPALNQPVSLPEAATVGSTATIASGGSTSCAVGVSGKVYCWGAGADGELGNGAAPQTSGVPVAVSGITGASTVTVGNYHACAVGTVGAMTGIACWGSENVGQLGNGLISPGAVSMTASAVKSTAAFTFFADATTTVSAGGEEVGTQSHDPTGTTCALRGVNVFCWGAAFYGQTGQGNYTAQKFATSTGGGALAGVNVAQIATSWGHACARPTANGKIYCWGSNRAGELMLPAATANSNVAVAVALDVVDLAVGAATEVVQDPMDGTISIETLGFTCGVTSSGEVQCLGTNGSGQQGTSGVTAGISKVVMP